MTTTDGTNLADLLFDTEGHLRTYAILDGASVPGLRTTLKEFRAESVCLFRGDLELELLEVAPYLITLKPESAITAWLLREGWGKGWGVFALSRAHLYPLAAHLRHFLIVHDPGGKKLYFRYYDPRVLQVYLPTCNKQEWEDMFGPVERFVSEGSDLGGPKTFFKAGWQDIRISNDLLAEHWHPSASKT